VKSPLRSKKAHLALAFIVGTFLGPAAVPLYEALWKIAGGIGSNLGN
jgi:hypothetical protein